MDEQHIENDPICSAFPEDMQFLMRLFSESDPKQRKVMLEVVKAIKQND